MAASYAGPAPTKRWALCLCLVAVLAGAAHGEGLRGYLVVQGDRVLAAESADRLFTPASVQKIVVSAAALHYLGHDHQIETVVRARGPIRDGVLDGDLVLEAAGDPTWSRTFFPDDPEAPLAALAHGVRRAGVVRVEGDLLLDLTRFPGRRAPTSRSQAEMGLGFGAPVSGLAIDENTAEIRIAPGKRPGERASVATDAAIELRNDTVTVTAARHGKGSVEFLPQWGDGAIRVRGEYPVTEAPYTVRVSLPAPELTAGQRLRHHLWREGVELRGAVRLAGRRSDRERAAVARGERSAVSAAGEGVHPRSGSDDVLARLFSPPLSEIVAPVLRDSSNWTAEMLVLQVALAATGEGRYDDGVEALGRFLVGEVGVPEHAFALDDASGLSPENLLAPQTVVSVLRFAWRASWRQAFFAALARPANGTLA
ncbi:MAG TPA: D-alanyl-D-alanine carboxypeptidase/D-alanyl-D-alanine-endopeptidase, partial [Thermoanaerobaculia bacterium]|nr:D-alanyl-D-alanine carboxypeptidase/D-alanyl-D-alanine-endopeptidase [Thermoanaerobaculia bacterium]